VEALLKETRVALQVVVQTESEDKIRIPFGPVRWVLGGRLQKVLIKG